MSRASWITVLAIVVLSSFAGAAEWPQFRGPNSSGIGDGKPSVEFGPSQNVLWKTAVGSIAVGRVFLVGDQNQCGSRLGITRRSYRFSRVSEWLFQAGTRQTGPTFRRTIHGSNRHRQALQSQRLVVRALSERVGHAAARGLDT